MNDVETGDGDSDNEGGIEDDTQLKSIAALSTKEQWPLAFRQELALKQLNDTQISMESWITQRKQLYIRNITWNLCARPPPTDLCDSRCFVITRCHILFIGTEECERSIAQSAFKSSKKQWEEYLFKLLKPDYVPIRSHTLQAIHLICFAHKDIAHRISDIKSTAVATGIQNTLGNKGAVMIHFRVCGTSFAITNAHLAAGQNSSAQRNKNYQLIGATARKKLFRQSVKRFSFQRAKSTPKDVNPTENKDECETDSLNHAQSDVGSPLDSPTERAGQRQKSRRWSKWFSEYEAQNLVQDTETILDCEYDGVAIAGLQGNNLSTINSAPDTEASPSRGSFPSSSTAVGLDSIADRVIFMGDLNYRMNGGRKTIEELLEKNIHSTLLTCDQLRDCMSRNEVLQNFTEAPLNFRPTYKYDIGTSNYDSSKKQRVPGWTDRILFVPRGLTCIEYDCDDAITTSDHKPVFATFVADLNTEENYVSNDVIQTSGTNSEDKDSNSKLIVSSLSEINEAEVKPERNGVISDLSVYDLTEELKVLPESKAIPEFTSKSQVCVVA